MGLLRRVASGWSKRGRPYRKCLRNFGVFSPDAGEAGAILDTPEADRFSGYSDASFGQ